MYRRIQVALKAWKESPYRKPLVLQGARQVGKTWSILEFGRVQYDNVAYFNFETDPLLSSSFEESIDPSVLIPILSRLSGQTITKGRTLLVLDEIQLCERAVTSLKYFCENSPEVHVIAAGSLLGVAVNRGRYSFPVGKVDMMTLPPMDVEEFFLACGDEELVERIRGCFERNEPMPAALHEAALARYRTYLLVGGMPECVAKYVATQDVVLVRHTQDSILTAYLNDLGKYNSQSDIRKTRLVFDTITVQLSKKNTRFQYKMLRSGARAAEFENAIEWLVLSGIMIRIFRVDCPRKPLEDHRDIDSFKTYLTDTGLLCAKKDVLPHDLLVPSRELDDFKGGLAANYVCAQLSARGHRCFYWSSDRGAEVDFVVQRDGHIVPIEVKSADNTRSKSLGVYITTNKPETAFRLSTRNFGREGVCRLVPLYAAFCI